MTRCDRFGAVLAGFGVVCAAAAGAACIKHDCEELRTCPQPSHPDASVDATDARSDAAVSVLDVGAEAKTTYQTAEVSDARPETGATRRVDASTESETEHTDAFFENETGSLTEARREEAGAVFPADGAAASADAAPASIQTPTPSVLSSLPAAGSSEVERNSSVQVLFSEPMDAASLRNGGLKLLLPGAIEVEGTITVAGATATFTPAHDLVLAAQYTVAVTSVAKSIEGAPVGAGWTSSFTVREGKWSSPAPVEADPEGHGIAGSSIAMDLNGNAILAWSRHTADGPEEARIARYVRGKGWQPADQFPLAIVWGSQRVAIGRRQDAMFAAYTTKPTAMPYDGTSWLYPTDLGTSSQVHAIALDGAGRALVVLREIAVFGDGGNSVYVDALEYMPRTGWSSYSPITRTGSNSAYSGPPSLAVNSGGQGILVWTDSTSLDEVISYSSYEPGGTPSWSMASQIPFSIKGYAPSAAIDDSGNAVSVWIKPTLSSGGNIVASVLHSSGHWAEPTTISDPGGNARYPAVAATPAGIAVAIWSQGPINGEQIQVSRYVPQEGWSAAETIATHTGGPRAPAPRIFLDAGGNGFALWKIPDIPPTVNPYVFCRYVREVWASPPEPSSGELSTSLRADTFALSENGDAMVVWPVCTDSTHCEPWYRVFD